MTIRIKEIQDAIIRQEAIMQTAKNAITRLQSELVTLAPFKVGDKVRVMDGASEVTAYVSDVYIAETWQDEIWEYKFTKPKKDGTMGGQSAGIYCGQPLKLV